MTTTVPRIEKTYTEFTFPTSAVSPEFFNHFTEADLTFGIAEPTAAQMESAARLAGSNSMEMGKELLFACMHLIGGKRPSRGYASEHSIEHWYDLIGPKCREMLMVEYATMMTPTEEEAETFRATKKVRRG
jgi:hypothetical protein